MLNKTGRTMTNQLKVNPSAINRSNTPLLQVRQQSAHTSPQKDADPVQINTLLNGAFNNGNVNPRMSPSLSTAQIKGRRQK
jgi:hypothetical protein